jgi:uncharacterized damage-inducible protein DinB
MFFLRNRKKLSANQGRDMKKNFVVVASVMALWIPIAASGQTVTSTLEGLFEVTKGNIMASAQMLDEDMYAFRPVDEVRSMGEIFAHIAGAQYSFCSAASGESSPNSENFEDTRTTKARILDALEGGFAYCDEVFSHTVDADGANSVSFFTGPNTVFGVLAFNSAHNYEHYGNLVTYMRLNGITPPSSMQ